MNIKKLFLAFSLCLAMVLALFVFEAGVFSSVREEDLYGSWLTGIPAAERVEQSLAQFGIVYDIDDTLEMTYEFCYHQDGTLTVCVEKESAKKIADAQIEAFRVGLPEMVYNQYLAEANMSREETDAMLAAQGLTMETFVDLALSQIDFEAQLTNESAKITQYYCLKNGTLYYSSTPMDPEAGNYEMTVEPLISGNSLVLSNACDKEGVPYEGNGMVQYPLTLTRK